MQYNRMILLIAFVSILTGCFDACTKTYWKEGNYEVRDDAAYNISLLYDLGGAGHGRVSCVTKIGYNERYMIIESKKECKNESFSYWILDKSQDRPALNAEEIMQGPYSLSKFENRKEELEIGDLKFEKEFAE